MPKPAALLLAALAFAPLSAALAQTAADMKSGQTDRIKGETDEQHGQRLMRAMVEALGGQAWLDHRAVTIEGQTASFFQGQPTGSVVRFVEYQQQATWPPAPAASAAAAAPPGSTPGNPPLRPVTPEQTRVEYLTVRGMIKPGMKRDTAHLWTADNGYELTYKGRTTLPADQVADYLRRRDHSLSTLVHAWLPAPGTLVIYLGQGVRDRRPIDRVSLLASNNDAVTLELDQGTHLPVARSFEWRNQQFKDHDLDEEVYGDWRAYDGIQTPMNVTRYRNGDMASQTFYTKVTFNEALPADAFALDRYPGKK